MRYPTLDEIEHGHTVESAYLAGDVEALDALAAADGLAGGRCLDSHPCPYWWCAEVAA